MVFNTAVASARRLGIYLFLIAFLLNGRSLMASSVKADDVWQRLLEHWRWQRFWYGASDADQYYSVGAKDQVRLFWTAAGVSRGIGICSQRVALCQFYPDVDRGWLKSERSVPKGSSRAGAEEAFIRDAYDQFPPTPDGFRQTTTRSIVFPPWQVPLATQERTMRGADELARLIKLVRCGQGKRSCRSKVLVPFYRETDPRVLIYRECHVSCDGSNPVIVMVQLIDKKWYLGATNIDSSKAFVEKTRQQIERTVMLRIEE